MIDFNLAGLDPAVAQLFTAMNNRPSIDANRLRISNEMRNQEIDDRRLSQLNPNLGVMAPLVAGLQGLAKAQGRRNSEKTLEQLFGQMEQAQAQERYAAQVAKEQERMRAVEAAKIARQQELEDAQLAHERSIEQERAKQQAIAENREPEGPSKRDIVAAIQQSLATGKITQEQADEALAIEAPELLEYRQERAAAATAAEQDARNNENILAALDSLLSPKNEGAMAAATGGLEGGWFGDVKNAITPWNQDAIDWKNQFEGVQAQLTVGNLDLLTGVLSDSDLRLLERVGTNGIDLTSGDKLVRDQLSALRNYYAALAGQPVREAAAPQVESSDAGMAGGFQIPTGPGSGGGLKILGVRPKGS